MNKVLILLIFSVVISCSNTKTDPISEKVVIEPNAEKRARAAADKGGGIFGDINNKKKDSGVSYNFANSNPLWRATLKTLDFLPLINADYSGGVIIYDWYSENLNSNEQIKVSIKFLSDQIRSNSFEITAHKKNCDVSGKCFMSKADDKFSNEIKDAIITTARSISIEEKKREIK